MNIKQTIYLIVVLVFLFIILLCINNFESKNNSEHMINIPKIKSDSPSWTQTSTCKYLLDETTRATMKSSNINKINDNSADIIFPCGYNDINNEIKALPTVYYGHDSKNDPKRIFIIDGADEITAKNYLWKNILQHHGLRKAQEMSPDTFILSEPFRSTDLARLEKNHHNNKLYILKKNIQRQTGLEITNDIEKIKSNVNGYVLAQELITDSYLVNGRKINLRVYIVVVCYKNHTDVYMFNNGFMYYTKNKFDNKHSLNMDDHVTTGYVDRDVYEKNPLTHTDFKKYLDLDEGFKYHESNDRRMLYQNEKEIRSQGLNISTIIFKRIEKLLSDVFISFKGKICRKIDDNNNEIPIYNDYTVQIFGADIAINDQLQPQIIEINKGPDLSPKDNRDGDVKKQMVNDVLEIIGIKEKKKDNGLIHVLEM